MSTESQWAQITSGHHVNSVHWKSAWSHGRFWPPFSVCIFIDVYGAALSEPFRRSAHRSRAARLFIGSEKLKIFNTHPWQQLVPVLSLGNEKASPAPKALPPRQSGAARRFNSVQNLFPKNNEWLNDIAHALSNLLWLNYSTTSHNHFNIHLKFRF